MERFATAGRRVEGASEAPNRVFFKYFLNLAHGNTCNEGVQLLAHFWAQEVTPCTEVQAQGQGYGPVRGA